MTWQGRPPQPDPLQMLPITLSLRLASGGPDNEYMGFTTDASGYFTVPVGTLPGGLYSWAAKDPIYLANGGVFTLTGGINNIEMGLMRTGDCDDNNVDNSVDFSILRSTFGLSIGQTGYDERADFDGNQVIGATDFGLLKSNFGTGGVPPLGP